MRKILDHLVCIVDDMHVLSRQGPNMYTAESTVHFRVDVKHGASHFFLKSTRKSSFSSTAYMISSTVEHYDEARRLPRSRRSTLVL